MVCWPHRNCAPPGRGCLQMRARGFRGSVPVAATTTTRTRHPAGPCDCVPTGRPRQPNANVTARSALTVFGCENIGILSKIHSEFVVSPRLEVCLSCDSSYIVVRTKCPTNTKNMSTDRASKSV
uniref:Uncharacterized protein n=1 Tax=Sipha flava TaxID=143950 RepID=A0A2S2Q4T4_9HEMI